MFGSVKMQFAKNTHDSITVSWVLYFIGLFFYGDFLPILERKFHLVIVDRNLADEPFDILLIKAPERGEHSVKYLGVCPDVLCSLCFQCDLVRQGI